MPAPGLRSLNEGEWATQLPLMVLEHHGEYRMVLLLKHFRAR